MTKKSRYKKLFKKYNLYILIASIILNLILTSYIITKNITFNTPFSSTSVNTANTASSDKTNQAERDNVFEEINPAKGYEINASFDNLGPKMIEMGVIDFNKLKDTYAKSGQPLTDEQITILTKGSDRKIKVDRNNSYFLLNFFWAVGLANKTKILTDGDMVKYGQGQTGNFASTGGWTLTKTTSMDYYAKGDLINLTPEQENLVEQVASNIYRPCCNNSTAFPDCNHGMALLGILELMASNGASQDQMYNAAKYFNAFWFPGNYYDLAQYFKNKEGKDFSQINARIILGKEFSSASGYQTAKQYLSQKGIVKEPPRSGGGCGV